MAKTSASYVIPDQTTTSSTQEDLKVKLRQLEAERDFLKAALEPLAKMPDDPAQPDDYVLYSFVRSSGKSQIHCGDIRRARQAMK